MNAGSVLIYKHMNTAKQSAEISLKTFIMLIKSVKKFSSQYRDSRFAVAVAIALQKCSE